MTHTSLRVPMRPILLMAALTGLLPVGCTTVERASDWRPALASADAYTAGSAAEPDAAQVRRLQLIAANLVSVLVQLPAYAPGTTTLQVSEPSTPFGLVLVRTLEDAGFGLQRVSADQGANYVGYRRRVSETDAGEVIDYGMSIGAMSLSREFSMQGDAVFPASLMVIDGADPASLPPVDDSAFREQGGNAAFVSGIRDVDGAPEPGSVQETLAADYHALPLERRNGARDVVAQARRRADADRATVDGASFDAADYQRLRRTVLIFPAGEIERMGPGNKEAVRLLARDIAPADVFLITACTDADGRNEAADARGLRVRNEFLSHGVPSWSVRLAPCVRASFRHASDDSPVPVEIVQHRKRS